MTGIGDNSSRRKVALPIRREAWQDCLQDHPTLKKKHPMIFAAAMALTWFINGNDPQWSDWAWPSYRLWQKKARVPMRTLKRAPAVLGELGLMKTLHQRKGPQHARNKYLPLVPGRYIEALLARGKDNMNMAPGGATAMAPGGAIWMAPDTHTDTHRDTHSMDGRLDAVAVEEEREFEKARTVPSSDSLKSFRASLLDMASHLLGGPARAVVAKALDVDRADPFEVRDALKQAESTEDLRSRLFAGGGS